MHPFTPASVLGQRYLPHICDLCAYLAEVAARHRNLSPLLVLVWVRWRRMLVRLDRLAARWQQGRLRPARVYAGTRAPAAPRPLHPADAWRPRRTPRGEAWLIRRHQRFAQFTPRIEALLADPEIAALCAAAPRAARLLRPLCRMFGLTPPHWLSRPQAPPKPRPPAPPAPIPEPPFAEHSPLLWPFVPHRLRLRVPRLRRPKPPH